MIMIPGGFLRDSMLMEIATRGAYSTEHSSPSNSMNHLNVCFYLDLLLLDVSSWKPWLIWLWKDTTRSRFVFINFHKYLFGLVFMKLGLIFFFLVGINCDMWIYCKDHHWFGVWGQMLHYLYGQSLSKWWSCRVPGKNREESLAKEISCYLLQANSRTQRYTLTLACDLVLKLLFLWLFYCNFCVRLLYILELKNVT